MVKMAALAPKGVFEEEDFYVPAWEEPPYERHFDDYTRNCDEGRRFPFQILRSRRPYAGTAVRRGCWGCPSDT